MEPIRVGIVGLGTNTRLRHVPGLLACEGVSIEAVCNRRPESTRSAAQEFGIAKTYDDWRQLVDDSTIDAVVIGTWPYLHCEITLAALDAGKHVLTEARMASSAHEAHEMLAASRRHPNLVTQIVPSPMGLKADKSVKEMIASGFLGTLQEVVVLGTNSAYADPSTNLTWRQSAEFSGMNILSLGIFHETLIRWIPDPVRVVARTALFTEERVDADTGEHRPVDIPDSVQVLADLPDGARAVYHLSGVAYHGPRPQIQLFGSEGTMVFESHEGDRLFAARGDQSQLQEVALDKNAVGWRVEQDFIDAIRGIKPIEFTDFDTGVRYMEFTEAVWRSARSEQAVTLPLASG